ncbi:unnamed protein product [Mytilus edulis]|uniref:Uncharacterized protein n=1 Tax=Mytilus edulis TaxID=6550 RepID=A0A8S3QJS2_MYTED|nr:unnamed protein product [Mytilus edulis]
MFIKPKQTIKVLNLCSFIQGAVVVEPFNLWYKIDRLEEQKKLIIDAELKICLEKEDCSIIIKLFDQQLVSQPLCDMEMGGQLLDFSLQTFLTDNAVVGNAESLDLYKLMDELGVTSELKDAQCSRSVSPYSPMDSNGWNIGVRRQYHFSLPSVPNTMSCHLTDTCTGIDCCIDVEQISRSINVYIKLDACNYKLTAGIEKLTLDVPLLNYEFDISLKELSENLLLDVTQQLPSYAADILLERLGISQWMQAVPCSRQSSQYTPNVKGWKIDKINEVKLSHLISLRYSVSDLEEKEEVHCKHGNNCLFGTVRSMYLTWNILKDVYLPKLGCNWNEDFSDFSPSKLLQDNGLTELDDLSDFDPISGPGEDGYTIDNTENMNEFRVNLNVTIQLDDQTILYQSAVMKDTPLLRTQCDWNTGFDVQDFSLQSYINQLSLPSKDQLTELMAAKLIEELGIGGLLQDTPCQRSSPVYSPSINGWKNEQFVDRGKNGHVHSFDDSEGKVVLHIYESTNTLHIQGKGCIFWFKNTFKIFAEELYHLYNTQRLDDSKIVKFKTVHNEDNENISNINQIGSTQNSNVSETNPKVVQYMTSDCVETESKLVHSMTSINTDTVITSTPSRKSPDTNEPLLDFNTLSPININHHESINLQEEIFELKKTVYHLMNLINNKPIVTDKGTQVTTCDASTQTDDFQILATKNLKLIALKLKFILI